LPFNADGIGGLVVVVAGGLNCFIELTIFCTEDFAWGSLETFHFFLFFAAEKESVTCTPFWIVFPRFFLLS
jgi:hypothetical protein